MNVPHVHCIVVNYRTPELAEVGLASIAATRGSPRFRLDATLVDNFSNDGSAEKLAAAIARHGWGDWVKLIASPRNGGFAAGNNLALKEQLAAATPADYFFLLNPDARAEAGAIPALVNFLEANPRSGIAGSRIVDERGDLQHSAFRFPSVWSEISEAARLGVLDRLLTQRLTRLPATDRPMRCDWVSGAAMLLRRSVVDVVGLLDEGYFLDYEETDFCFAASARGFECWYVPESRVTHGVAKSKALLHTSPRKPAYWFNSRRRFLTKNYGRAYAASTDLLWILAFVSWRIRRRVQAKPDVDPPQMLRDFIAASALFRGA